MSGSSTPRTTGVAAIGGTPTGVDAGAPLELPLYVSVSPLFVPVVVFMPVAPLPAPALPLPVMPLVPVVVFVSLPASPVPLVTLVPPVGAGVESFFVSPDGAAGVEGVAAGSDTGGVGGAGVGAMTGAAGAASCGATAVKLWGAGIDAGLVAPGTSGWTDRRTRLGGVSLTVAATT